MTHLVMLSQTLGNAFRLLSQPISPGEARDLFVNARSEAKVNVITDKLMSYSFVICPLSQINIQSYFDQVK